MHRFSVQIFAGSVQPLPDSGRPTGMYKTPCVGSVAFGVHGIEGDQQADLRVHGGPEKAVHLYPSQHYTALAQQFPDIAARLIPGALGENLAVAGLDETQVRIGDLWQLGDVVLQVCQPRNPCWKIDERLRQDGVAEWIARQQLTGWYWRVVQPGRASDRDFLCCWRTNSSHMTLRDAMVLWAAHRPDLAALTRLSHTEGIALQWRAKIEQRLKYLQHHETR